MCGSIILDACNDAKRAGFDGPYNTFFGGVEAPTDKLIKRVGNHARGNFTRRTPGLEKLKRILDDQVNRHNRVPGLDGRKIPVRASHSALNFLIQSAGAILCKRWGCDAFDNLSSRFTPGWDGDFVFVLWVHDEYQVACRKGLEQDVGETLVKYAKSAGDAYGFRVPLDSKYSVGKTWAETH
jgi:DNA polymerase I-like protein with 3'-5' exonuclease and polymerase domains